MIAGNLRESGLGLPNHVVVETDDDELLRLFAGTLKRHGQAGDNLRSTLHLDKHPPALGNGRQHIVKLGNANALPLGPLPRPDVELPQLGERLIHDLAVHAGKFLGGVIMVHHDVSVLGQIHIHLHRVGTLLPAEPD